MTTADDLAAAFEPVYGPHNWDASHGATSKAECIHRMRELARRMTHVAHDLKRHGNVENATQLANAGWMVEGWADAWEKDTDHA